MRLAVKQEFEALSWVGFGLPSNGNGGFYAQNDPVGRHGIGLLGPAERDAAAYFTTARSGAGELMLRRLPALFTSIRFSACGSRHTAVNNH